MTAKTEVASVSENTPVAPIVQVHQGRVSGLSRPGSYAYFGIPYAQAPKGNLRFEAPRPAEAWSGVKDGSLRGATGLAETVPGTLVPEPALGGGNILNLDVYTPNPTSKRPLPVLVWIHGGGFVAGSPASPWYDGRAFNRDGVVQVSVSYRLGFEGFGYVPDAPLNRGVLDWIAALNWVQENIAAFGGDPSQVTVAGQSAGGTAVLALLAAPRAQKLFHRGWSASPAHIMLSVKQARRTSKRLADLLGVPPTKAGFLSASRKDIYGRQQEAGEPEARGLQKMRGFPDNLVSYGPTEDPALFPHSFTDAYRAGLGSDKALVIGSTPDEFTMITTKMTLPLSVVPKRLALAAFGADRLQRSGYVRAQKVQGTVGTAKMLGRYITDSLFRRTVIEAASARCEGSGGKAQTWLYSFEWPSPNYNLAIHCVDLPYLFDCLEDEDVPDLLGTNPPQALADELHGAAVRFVEEGNEPWPAWSKAHPVARIFDASGQPGEAALSEASYLPASLLG